MAINQLTIKADRGRHSINRHIYGHFAEHLGRCIYDGLWVGENSPIPNTRGIRNDVIQALRKINIPNVRWPGGCFADNYHWKDGIGPKDKRPRMINQWGTVTENNHFGTHEFMDLCDLIGCEPYLCGNVGSGTVQEMKEWVEYLTFDGDSPMATLRRQNGREAPWSVPFWGVGNENWGCGGNMSPEHYAEHYCQYQTYLGSYGDNRLLKIASGYGGSDTSGEGLDRLLGRILGRRFVSVEAVSLHYYVYLRDSLEHSATQFGEREWFSVLKRAWEIEDAIRCHVDVLDRYDPEKQIALFVDEWGNWYPPEPGTHPDFLYQQNSLRDALAAALSLHVFHAYGDRVKMANIAQLVNVLQALILTEKDQMVLTPTYHIFEMFKGHQDAALLPLDIDCESYTFDGDQMPAVSASASLNQHGSVLLTLCNLNPAAELTLSCQLQGMQVATVTGRLLTAGEMTAHNTFTQPNAVCPVDFDGMRFDGSTLWVRLPAKSVAALTIK